MLGTYATWKGKSARPLLGRGGLIPSVTMFALLLAVGFMAAPARSQEVFRRGDANNDGRVSTADAAGIFRWLGMGAAAPDCLAAADVRRDGTINSSDGLDLMRHLFAGGVSIPEPYPGCGADPSGPSSLPCAAAPLCDGTVPPTPGLFRLFISASPDAAEPSPGTREVLGIAGETRDLPFFVLLEGGAVQVDPGYFIDSGARAWSFGVRLETDSLEAELRDVATDGTAAADIREDAGGRRFPAGWELTEPAPENGAVTSVILCLLGPVTLDPRSAMPVLRGATRTRTASTRSRRPSSR